MSNQEPEIVSVSDLKSRLAIAVQGIFRALIDAFFLAIWVLMQWGLNEFVLARHPLSGIEQWQNIAFRILFAAATLSPFIKNIIGDIIDDIKEIRGHL